MEETQIRSNFVALTGEFGYPEALEAVEHLAGQEITAVPARLTVGERVGNAAFGGTWFSGRLHAGSPYVPSVAVDIVVTPWSSERTEIGIRPLARMGSFRTARFLRAAWPVTEALLDEVANRVSAGAPRLLPSLKVAA